MGLCLGTILKRGQADPPGPQGTVNLTKDWRLEMVLEKPCEFPALLSHGSEENEELGAQTTLSSHLDHCHPPWKS